jgi:hypothetical protein
MSLKYGKFEMKKLISLVGPGVGVMVPVVEAFTFGEPETDLVICRIN